MDHAILVLNAGSSSIKFSIYRSQPELALAYKGQIEGIGTSPHFVAKEANGDLLHEAILADAPDHRHALSALNAWIASRLEGGKLAAAGHRVVHGGADYSQPVVITEAVMADLRRYVPLAPLHQPHNLAGIQALAEIDADLVQVACFDTAFHRSNPQVAELFALPLELYQAGIRRYGFHGLSYEYISHRLTEVAPQIASGKVVIAHLGNGASMAAVENGVGVDSTMGFTALDGLPMGTRCGQIDPGVLLYLMTEQQMDAKSLETLLYKQSGLKGISGVSNDMRELERSDLPSAKLAIDYFIQRVVRETGALAATLGGIDGLIFTAGIGEHASHLRQRVCQRLSWLGIELDTSANERHATCITTPQSRVSAWVIPTDEELMIARHTLSLLA